jgi:two-component system response regulator
MKTILLVEDNPNDVALTRRAFEKSHLANAMVVAGDGEEALDYLFHRGRYASLASDDAPAMVLLDLKLPKRDGLEVLKAIRTHPELGLLPVIVLTSSTEERDLLCSYEFGANSYIQKPVDFKAFVDAVMQLGLYWLLLNEPPPTRREP